MPLKTPRQWCAKIDINIIHRKISDVVKRKIKNYCLFFEYLLEAELGGKVFLICCFSFVLEGVDFRAEQFTDKSKIIKGNKIFFIVYLFVTKLMKVDIIQYN